MTLSTTLFITGCLIALITLIAIIWSIFVPRKRIWPPKKYINLTPFLIWIPTFTLFGILISLGIMEWGEFYLPTWVRYWIGIPIIILANIAVWYEAGKFGMNDSSVRDYGDTCFNYSPFLRGNMAQRSILRTL